MLERETPGEEEGRLWIGNLPMRRERVLIVGYFGFGNAGDEAILAATLADLRELVPTLRPCVVSGNPTETAASHGVQAVPWRDPVALEQAVRETDLVLIGGGGLFHDYWGFNPDAMLSDSHWGLSFYAAPAVLAALHRKPFMLYAVGIGPLLSELGRQFTRAVGEAASAITVRDADSKKDLESLGIAGSRVIVSADPAFTLSRADKSRANHISATLGLTRAPRPRVAVSLRHWEIGVFPEFWERETALGLDMFVGSEGGSVFFIPFQLMSGALENDVAVANRVQSRMKHRDSTVVVEQQYSPSEIAALLGHFDLVLGMRLHAGIFAALGGVPLVSLSYDSKVKQLMTQIGSPELAIDLGEISAPKIADAMRRALARGDQYRQALREASERLRGLAGKSPRIAVELLQSGTARAAALTPELGSLVTNVIRSQLRTVQGLRSQLAESQQSAARLAAERETLAHDLDEARQREGELLRDRDRLDHALSDAKTELDSAISNAKAELARRQGIEQEAQRLFREATLLQNQLGAVRNELLKIHQSRLWRTASVYWAVRRWFRNPLRGREPERSPFRAPPAVLVETAARPERAPVSPAPVAVGNLHDVLCLPIIDWDFRFQRPQQLMSQFAEAGHRVFYVAQEFRADGPPYEIREKRSNVYEVSLRGLERNVYKDSLDNAARDALFASLGALRRDLSMGATALFVQLPFWWPLAQKARADFAWPVLYDCMDDHSGFTTNRPEMIEQEKDLLASADLVVVSAKVLEERVREHNTKVLRLPNACDYEHFSKVGSARGSRPVVGYYGAIADWFDAGLVADLAERRPDWDFVLVGSTFTADTSRLSKLSNVALPGEKPYAEIPQWLEKFDVAILPFKRLPLTEATSPVKAFEILAAGKPLVSVPIPEVASLAPLVRLASTAEEFEAEIAAALEERDLQLVARRRVFASENTWKKRFELLEPAVGNVFPKASIVLVTFNNLELNRLCLESLYERTEWPNFEVIVVDNGSTDGTPAYLKTAAEHFQNLRLIQNDKNLGFAAATNIGLQKADGDYLVLLNNDTVLARGWLSALIRHLASDRKLGLVGPVTNGVANEAKVEVGYERVEDMPSWAEQYIRQNDGKLFAIPMLAMFCLVMKREVLDSVGFLDERFGLGMFEDDDYNRRVRAKGYEIRCARDAFVHHWQKASFRLLGDKRYLELFEENRRKYEEKWGEAWKAEGVDVWKRADLGFYRDQVEAVVARVGQSKGAVIFLPSVGWAIQLAQRPHHLARTFAKEGYVAVFDSSNAHDDVNGFKEIEPNLFLFRGPDGLLSQLPEPLLWTFSYNFHQKDGYPTSAKTVYDWIDDLEVFPYDRKLLESNHARGLEEATVVASVAQRLHRRALERRPDAIYLPNGVDFDRFASDSAPLPEDRELTGLLESKKPIAGYYGALAEWFDYELLDAVAQRRQDWNFLLIGPMYDQSLRGQRILKRGNVTWLGPRDYQSLTGYLKAFDVAMIPFKINNITLATSPLKLYEFFAAGKPVITTPMPECQAFSEVHIVRGPEDFSAALDQARQQGQDAHFRERLRELARANSWTKRVHLVLEHVASACSGAGFAPGDRLGGMPPRPLA